jgi:hypothetical protein
VEEAQVKLGFSGRTRGAFLKPYRTSGTRRKNEEPSRAPILGRLLATVKREAPSAQNQIYLAPESQAKTMDAKPEDNGPAKIIKGRVNGRFAPGVSGNPGGSPEATRRAFNKRFLLDLAEDWQQHGREVFKRVRRESPASYLKVCAMLVPREMKLEHSGGVKAMTDEQLDRSIAFIEEMLAQREAGANATVIEGEAEVVPSLPAPGSGGTKMPKG